ncbi:MAG: 3-phosphoshikimate 1-carboxyvinyltransferase [Oscillospiraceae bacterium]|jgi:3-phosphoshikimate 1-carboxyvinyltransferase
MDVRILPGPLRGSVRARPSKSELHRALICSAFSDRGTRITLPSKVPASGLSDDISATAGCLRALGADISVSQDSIFVSPAEGRAVRPVLDCRNSGSTLRFLLPVSAAVSEEPRFEAGTGLARRPLSELMQCLGGHGISFSSDSPPFSLSGTLRGGEFRISAGTSSQYISGLLLALPFTDPGSCVIPDSPPVSVSYIAVTRDIMRSFGRKVDFSEGIYTVSEGRGYVSPGTFEIGGDWSNASYFLSAGLMPGCRTEVAGLDPLSPQGDKAVVGILQMMGGNIRSEDRSAYSEESRMTGGTIDIDPVPDLFPSLAAAACAARGRTVFRNIRRLRLKESDRIESTADMIRSLGGTVETGDSEFVICGTGSLRGGTVDSHDDHRIVMAAAAASCICREPVTITGAEAAAKSYPSFFEDFTSLGGKAYAV